MICPYCGSKTYWTEADFKGNEELRKKLLAYQMTAAENKENDAGSDTSFAVAGTDSFFMQNGQRLNIGYMWKHIYDRMACYLAKDTVVYVFDGKNGADAFRSGLSKLRFPEADNKLSRCFPALKMEVALEDGKCVLVFERRPNFYPAEMFAPWPSVHLAWVISRMENICCALEYSELEHRDISGSSIWINPVTHEGALFGDWRNVRPLAANTDLMALRKTAIALAEDTHKPIELYRFLNEKPGRDAFDDFSAWDKVIVNGFGGHRFVKM